MDDQSNHARDEILAYYQERATAERYATSPDFNLREIEIEYLGHWLQDGIKVLDVGCGNGYSTLCHATNFAASFTGIDFVPDMIESANRLAEDFKGKGEVAFHTWDVTNLDFPDGVFDVVISERCLLNLPTRDDQWSAMREIARVLKLEG